MNDSELVPVLSLPQLNLVPPILEERKYEFADSSGAGADPHLTIDEGEFDYDLTGIDTDEHLEQDFEEKLNPSIHRVQHPNREYIRSWKSKGISSLADNRR